MASSSEGSWSRRATDAYDSVAWGRGATVGHMTSSWHHRKRRRLGLVLFSGLISVSSFVLWWHLLVAKPVAKQSSSREWESSGGAPVHRILNATLRRVPGDVPGENGEHQKRGGYRERGGFVNRIELHNLAWQYQREGIIILLVCNLGYFDFFENWASHAKDIGLERHFIAIAEDAASYSFIERNWPGHGVRLHVPEMEGTGGGMEGAGGEMEDAGGGITDDNGIEIAGKAVDINSHGFKQIMYRRLFYLRSLLGRGLGVLLCDVDTFFLKDPFPYFRGRYDLLGVVEIPDAYKYNATKTFLRIPQGSMFLCGGFLLFKDTPYAHLILDHLVNKIFRSPPQTDQGAAVMNDQTYLHNSLQDLYWRLWHFRPRIGILPQQLFPPGWLFFRNATWRKEKWADVVWVHNNWVPGKEFKVLRYRALHLWRVKEAMPQNKYCALANTCKTDKNILQQLAAHESSSLAGNDLNQGQDESEDEGQSKQGNEGQSEQNKVGGSSGGLPFPTETAAVFADVARAKLVLQSLKWGSNSKSDASAISQGFIIFCIPLPGEERLLHNWVASLEAVQLNTHLLLVALTEVLHNYYEATWPGHSILLGPHVQAAASDAGAAAASSSSSSSSSSLTTADNEDDISSTLNDVTSLGGVDGSSEELVKSVRSKKSFSVGRDLQEPMSMPVLLLALQPFVLRALLSITGSGTTLLYSEVDSVIVKNVARHIPEACSVAVATREPVQLVEQLAPSGRIGGAAYLSPSSSPQARRDKAWLQKLRGAIPVNGGVQFSESATTKLFAVRADATGEEFARSWGRQVARQWDRISGATATATEQVDVMMMSLSDAIRLDSTVWSGQNATSAPGGSRPECHLAVLARNEFPPDFLVFKHTAWLQAHYQSIVVVRNDGGQVQNEIVSAYKQLGLWAAA